MRRNYDLRCHNSSVSTGGAASQRGDETGATGCFYSVTTTLVTLNIRLSCTNKVFV